MKQLEVINFESFAKVYPAYNELFHNYKEKHVAQNMQLIENIIFNQLCFYKSEKIHARITNEF